MLVIVHTLDGEVLLLKRTFPFEFWQSVTGSLEPGEQPADAALRELGEETGLADARLLHDTGNVRSFEIDPRWLAGYAPGVTRNREHEFHYRLASPCEIKLNAEEHSLCGWMPIDEAIRKVWSWTNREALEALPLRKFAVQR